ncbi:MAG: hypothetical protein DRJ31_09580, partial [Candidatus Methanomethylicota archaeon]
MSAQPLLRFFPEGLACPPGRGYNRVSGQAETGLWNGGLSRGMMPLRSGRRVCSSEPVLDASGLKIDGESIDWREGKAAAASTSFSV